MSLIPTIYSSTDPGAPVLSGQAGSLVALLDAILVDGYGSGGNAKAPLGWSREFTATNKRAYRLPPVGTTGYYLRVDDTAMVGNARHAWLRGHKSLSDIDTGTDAVPDAAIAANSAGIMWIKSITADGTARAWWAIGNERALYLFIAASNNAEREVPLFVGDITTRMAVDGYNFVIAGSPLATYTGTTSQSHSHFLNAVSSWSSTSTTLAAASGVIARGISGLPGAEYVTIPFFGAGTIGSGSGFPYPDAAGNELIVDHIRAKSAAQWGFRGYFPGVLGPAHDLPLVDRQRYDDLQVLGGVSVIAKNFKDGGINTSTGMGQVLFVVDQEW